MTSTTAEVMFHAVGLDNRATFTFTAPITQETFIGVCNEKLSNSKDSGY